jgi:hypothetical protein
VAEELLDVPHVGAVLDEVGGAGVAQSMRRDGERDLGALAVHQHEVADVLGCDARPKSGEEEGALGGVLHEQGPRVAQVEVEGIRRAAEDGHDTVLPPHRPAPRVTRTRASAHPPGGATETDAAARHSRWSTSDGRRHGFLESGGLGLQHVADVGLLEVPHARRLALR